MTARCDAAWAARRALRTLGWGAAVAGAVLAVPLLVGLGRWVETGWLFPTTVAVEEVRLEAGAIRFRPVFDKWRDCELVGFAGFLDVALGLDQDRLRLYRALASAPPNTRPPGRFAGEGSIDWRIEVPAPLAEVATGWGLQLTYRCHPLWTLSAAFRWPLPRLPPGG